MAGQLHTGTLKSFDAGTYTARVTLERSLQMSLAGVPVSRAIPSGELTAGRKVAVAIFDVTKATDAVVMAVWT